MIATGTPAGVGKGFTPPKFLHAGDEVVIPLLIVEIISSIEKIILFV
ncbi:hypothetical protein ACT4US_21745, partial [Bacillus sp. HC-Mk]